MSIFENNICKKSEDSSRKEQQESGSLQSFIDVVRKETAEVLRLFKTKFLSKNEGMISITSDALEKKIFDIVDVIRNVKIKSLAKNKDSQKENSLQIILSISRHDTINKLVSLISAIHLLKEHDNEGNKAISEEVQTNIAGIEKILEKTEETAHTIISGESLIHNVRQVAEDIKETYDNLKVKINYDCHDKCLIKTNGSLYSVFDNILANAIRHGHATEAEINIIEKNNKDLLIKIKNNGEKLKRGSEEKIFEKGFKSKETGNTGLGLALIRDDIEISHGEINAENTKDGVEFIIKFPLLQSK